MIKKFYVGVKGIIRTDKGYLVLKHAKGHYDTPGGRIDGDEEFEQTLRRELSEELPGISDVHIGDLLSSSRLHIDIEEDTSLVLLYFLVNATLPDPIVLSEEHQSYQWITSVDGIPGDIKPDIDTILRKLL